MAKSNSVSMIVSGLAMIRINKKNYLPNEEFEVTPEQAESTAIKSLVFTKQIEFADRKVNDEVSKELGAKVRKVKEEKDIKKLEDGGEIG